ncbi:hypothetical protein [Staphylococcus kloosii]|uniref:hypothetical protein n=1 Tax=Staphylococcus kloosii TaxID=29384 RepID=UPI0028A46077|nr:hypothetical protein [Staphylococcus kloosii]MDT3960353.1 hypothetical protein [Staphylococcus kloosii]
MTYYNRDNYERNLERYEVPEEYNNEDRSNFVYGFVIGAVIGTAIGLVTTKSKRNKGFEQSTSEFRSSIIKQSEEQRQAAENEVNHIKSSVSDSEVSAQKAAIQEESAENNLSNPTNHESTDNSSNTAATVGGVAVGATAGTTAGLAANKAESDNQQQSKEGTPSSKELSAQQNAIQKESSQNDLADPSVSNDDNTTNAVASGATATAGAGVTASNASDSQATTGNTQQDEDTVAPTEDSNKVSANKLARAAKEKHEAMFNDSVVAQNTKKLLQPEQPTNGKFDGGVPNLVTKSSNVNDDDFKLTDTKAATAAAAGTATAGGAAGAASVASENDKGSSNANTNATTKDNNKSGNSATGSAEKRVEQTHETVVFKDGHIVHDKASNNLAYNSKSEATDSNVESSKETNYKKNRPSQKNSGEKASSKIDKKTFND